MLVKSSRESTVAGQEPGDLGRGAAAPRRNEIIFKECIRQRHVLFVMLSPPFPLVFGGVPGAMRTSSVNLAGSDQSRTLPWASRS